MAAAAAALVLAVLSRGDALVLAVLLVAASWRPVAALAVVPALVAASWRWGSTALEAMAGAQAVLGPAGLVEPTGAAASSWLAAAALLLAAPIADRPRHRAPLDDVGTPRRARQLAAAPIQGAVPARLHRASSLVGGSTALLLAAASGAAAAAVVAGPAPGGELWVRVVASLVGTVAALAVGRVRAHRRGDRVLDRLAAAGGVLALVAVSADAPGWRGTVDGAALRTGAVLALAVAAAVAVGSAAGGALRARAQ